MKLHSLVMFCILMEGNDGIRGKAPSYIREKFLLAQQHPENVLPHLDGDNQKKYKKWKETWSKFHDSSGEDV